MDFRQQFLSGCLPGVLESSTGLIVSREGGEGASLRRVLRISLYDRTMDYDRGRMHREDVGLSLEYSLRLYFVYLFCILRVPTRLRENALA